MALSSDTELHVSDLPSPIQNYLANTNLQRLSRAVGSGGDNPGRSPQDSEASPPVPVMSLAERERQAIMAALDAANGHRVRAAEILQISRTTLYRRMKEYGME